MARLTMDLIYVDEQAPKRGDRLRSPKTLYYVLHARKVQRRDPNAFRRYVLTVAKAEELERETRLRLIASAIRAGGSMLFEFQWHPRPKKKKTTFEQLMRSHG